MSDALHKQPNTEGTRYTKMETECLNSVTETEAADMEIEIEIETRVKAETRWVEDGVEWRQDKGHRTKANENLEGRYRRTTHDASPQMYATESCLQISSATPTNLYARPIVVGAGCCWAAVHAAVDFNIYFDQTAQETNREFLLRPLNDISLKLLGRSVYSVFIKLNMAAGRDSICGAALFPAGTRAPNPVINRHKGAATHCPWSMAHGPRSTPETHACNKIVLNAGGKCRPPSARRPLAHVQQPLERCSGRPLGAASNCTRGSNCVCVCQSVCKLYNNYVTFG